MRISKSTFVQNFLVKNLLLSLKTTIIDFFFETQVFVAPLSINIALIHKGISKTKCNIKELDDLSASFLMLYLNNNQVYKVNFE